ncbi:MAG TPA: hypothetical protein DD706_12255 [Nitrospiraceae bacterium]|nr:hypothetical protein [Nitrospiraceae bacterium]
MTGLSSSALRQILGQGTSEGFVPQARPPRISKPLSNRLHSGGKLLKIKPHFVIHDVNNRGIFQEILAQRRDPLSI